LGAFREPHTELLLSDLGGLPPGHDCAGLQGSKLLLLLGAAEWGAAQAAGWGNHCPLGCSRSLLLGNGGGTRELHFVITVEDVWKKEE
jgi:hypothetical protein